VKPVNLYEFSKTFFLREKPLAVYEKFSSQRSKGIKVKSREIRAIEQCIAALSGFLQAEDWDGFFYSFCIPQISKEFDLLKIGANAVLNIELKSEYTQEDKLLKQLSRNEYYLSHLNKQIIEIVYVADKNAFFKLKDGNLAAAEGEEVARAISNTKSYYEGDIEALFRPSQFLVSPVNTPEKFISGKYFLTDHQENIKRAIFKDRESGSGAPFYQIAGGAGTGKTLLIYDLAKTFSQSKKICVIHCSRLVEGHGYLNDNLQNFSIFAVGDLFSVDFGSFDGIVVDEAQRLSANEFSYIREKVKELDIFCVFGTDGEQCVSGAEAANDANGKICNLQGCKRFRLTNKIRTNPELADFINLLRNVGRPVKTKSFPDVKILYADTREYARALIEKYAKKGYKYISLATSPFGGEGEDEGADRVIGREYDKVLMVVNEKFAYTNDGRLIANEQPVPEYLFERLLYQGLTRVREKLIVIILNNKPVFERLLSAIRSS